MNGSSRKIFWSLIFLFHLGFLTWQLIHQQVMLVDSEEYLQEAENIIESGDFYCGDPEQPVRMDNYTKRPPVYPLFLALVISVFGNKIWVIVFQTLLSFLNVWLSLKLIRQIYGQITHPIILLIFIALYPAQFIYTNLIMTEILFQTSLILMAIWAIQAWKSNSYQAFWLYTLALIAGIFIKPILYLFIFPHFIVGGIFIWKTRKFQLILPVIMPLVIVLGYMNWNAQRTGFFHFSSIQNLSLLQYTTYNLLIHTYGQEEALVRADSILYASLEQPTYAQGQQLLQRECFAVISENKLAFLGFHLKGIMNFFIDPGRFDLYTFWGLQSNQDGQGFLASFSQGGYRGMFSYLWSQPLGIIFLLVLIAGLNGLKTLSFFYFGFCKKTEAIEKIIILGIILYIAGLTGSSGASRFAVPVFPLILVTLPCFLDRIILGWKKFRK